MRRLNKRAPAWLRVCGICDEQESKYRCPTCDLRYCSLACYKPHKASHEAEIATPNDEKQPTKGQLDRPGTTQRVPKVDFTGFEKDKEFQQLLVRYPSLKLQLGTLYGLTLDPGPDNAWSWNRQPLPGMVPSPAPKYRGRGRVRGRGGRDSRGGRRSRDDDHDWRDERETGQWTREKGEKEALHVLKTMKESRETSDKDAAEGMREFVALCRIRFAQ